MTICEEITRILSIVILYLWKVNREDNSDAKNSCFAIIFVSQQRVE